MRMMRLHEVYTSLLQEHPLKIYPPGDRGQALVGTAISPMFAEHVPGASPTYFLSSQ